MRCAIACVRNSSATILDFMDDRIPDSTPEDPQQPQAPDGWELAILGIMRNAFGRRPTHALRKAMMQLSAERAWVESQPQVRVHLWKKAWRAFIGSPGFQFGTGLAVAAVLAVVAWIFFPKGPANSNAGISISGCRITDAANARWSRNGAQLKVGDVLPSGPLRLESGVVELAFASGAHAAVEGPAELTMSGPNGIELRQGKIAAHVPRPAIGFTVHTRNATVTDLGTRFGVNAAGADSSEVDVFEGKVHVADQHDAKEPNNQWDLTRSMAMVLDQRGGVTTAAAPETAFPQLARMQLIRPANCGFDSQGSVRIGGFPSALGFWSGPAFVITGPVDSIRPVEGKGMLRFLAPPHQGTSVPDSVVWQLVDLRQAKDFVSAYGTVDLKAWVQFNRVAGDSHTASKFRLTIAAFRGDPATAPALWAARNETAVAIAEKELTADDDPTTWERVEVATTVTPEADFVVLEMRAVAPRNVRAGEDPFPGHFADLIDAKVCVPLRASGAVAAH